VQSTIPGSLKLGVIVQADAANSGNIFLGGLGVTTSTGIQLVAGATLSLNNFGTSKGIHEWNLTQIYLISNLADQAVRVSWAEQVAS